MKQYLLAKDNKYKKILNPKKIKKFNLNMNKYKFNIDKYFKICKRKN